MITESVEARLYRYVTNKIIKTEGAIFHAIGGIETHLHIAATVKPTIQIDKWIGQLKGASSHDLGKLLEWQHGYGVVSFGTRDLPWVVEYILNQKEHHRSGEIYDRLERIEDDG